MNNKNARVRLDPRFLSGTFLLRANRETKNLRYLQYAYKIIYPIPFSVGFFSFEF